MSYNDDNQIENYLEILDDEINLDIDISYDNNNDFDIWLFNNLDGYEEEILLKFKYLADGSLDSIIAKVDDEGYIFFVIFDYLVENDLVKEITYSYYEENEIDHFEKRLFIYKNNNELDSLLIYDWDGTDENLYNIYRYFYDDYERLDNIIISNSDEEVIELLDFDFAENGNLEKFKAAYAAGTDFFTYQVSNYLSENTIPLSSVFGPQEIWRYFNDLDIDDRIDKYYAFKYGNQILEEIEDVEEYDSEYFYSINVGTKESRAIAKPLAIYPNPAVNLLTVETDAQLTTYQIYDLLGQVVNEGFMNNNTLDVSSLVSGQYTLVFTSDDNKIYFSSLLK